MFVSGDTITVTWNEVAQAEKYDVYRDGNYVNTVVGTNVTTFTDPSMASGSYDYNVVSIDEDNDPGKRWSVFSATVSANVVGNSANVPGNFRGDAYGTSSAELFWNTANDSAHGGDATGYIVYRNDVQIHTYTNGETSHYMNTGLQANVTYKFEVVAVYPDGAQSAKAGPGFLKISPNESF